MLNFGRLHSPGDGVLQAGGSLANRAADRSHGAAVSVLGTAGSNSLIEVNGAIAVARAGTPPDLDTDHGDRFYENAKNDLDKLFDDEIAIARELNSLKAFAPKLIDLKAEVDRYLDKVVGKHQTTNTIFSVSEFEIFTKGVKRKTSTIFGNSRDLGGTIERFLDNLDLLLDQMLNHALDIPVTKSKG